jgi:protein SCO1
MSRMTRREWLAGPAIGSAFGAVPDASSNSRNSTGALTPRDKIRARYFPNVALRTHEGKAVRFYDDVIKGKVVTINVMYATCEGICPSITTNLAKVQKLLGRRVGRDIFMYSISIKPEEDTPSVLKEYVRMHGIGPGWTYLTGTPDDVELLRRKLGFTNPNPELDTDASQHIGNVRYGNEPLMLWAACPGQADPEWIVKSISWVLGTEHPTAR